MQRRPLLIMLPGLLLLSSCTFLFFMPGGRFVLDSETAQYAPEDVYFKNQDGLTLHGWHLKARGQERGTILICHGNSENLSTHVKLDLWLVDRGYNLFIFDYRGYGKSEGTAEVKGVNRDAEAALEALLARLGGRSTEKIIFFGKSLGGAVAVYTVANTPHKDRIKGLIVDSAFAGYRMIAREKIAGSIIGWPVRHPLSFLINDDYSPIDYIDRIHPVPVLIMHGYLDEIVPPHHGRILYEAASAPKEYWEVTIPGHVKSWTHEPTRERIMHFLAGLD